MMPLSTVLHASMSWGTACYGVTLQLLPYNRLAQKTDGKYKVPSPSVRFSVVDAASQYPCSDRPATAGFTRYCSLRTRSVALSLILLTSVLKRPPVATVSQRSSSTSLTSLTSPTRSSLAAHRMTRSLPSTRAHSTVEPRAQHSRTKTHTSSPQRWLPSYVHVRPHRPSTLRSSGLAGTLR